MFESAEMNIGAGAAAYPGFPYVEPQNHRDALIERHLSLVRFVAERVASRLPACVEVDDLIGAGVLGLMDAVEKFDKRRGVEFKTYAEVRIRGAILDSVRGLDWVPRSVRRRSREIQKIIGELEAKLGRAPEEEEIAAAANLSLAEFHELLTEFRSLKLFELDAEDNEETGSLLRQIAAPESSNPLKAYEASERRERLTSAIDRLSERDRQVVALYYVEELTQKEIGMILGVTESRVCQILSQAILRLRSMLTDA
jgi:RNA polymerase sigma factor for flagellar operon FliA